MLRARSLRHRCTFFIRTGAVLLQPSLLCELDPSQQVDTHLGTARPLLGRGHSDSMAEVLFVWPAMIALHCWVTSCLVVSLQKNVCLVQAPRLQQQCGVVGRSLPFCPGQHEVPLMETPHDTVQARLTGCKNKREAERQSTSQHQQQHVWFGRPLWRLDLNCK